MPKREGDHISVLSLSIPRAEAMAESVKVGRRAETCALVSAPLILRCMISAETVFLIIGGLCESVRPVSVIGPL